MHRERMSGVDRAWLRMDSPRNPMVIIGLFSFAEPLAFGQLSRLFAQRLLRFERFRQRVEEDVAGHWWVDDPSFRLSNHLKRVRLDDASETSLREHLDRMAAQPLDFSRPLWEMHFIERPGAPPAMAMRIHHCIADGVALVRVMLALAAQAPPPRRRKRAGPADESAWQAWLDAAAGAARSSLWLGGEVWTESKRTFEEPGHALDLAQAGARVVADAVAILAMTSDTPTSLKGEPRGIKAFAWNDPLPLDELKPVCRALGASLNDVVLACVTGALRRYLLQRGDALAPDAEFRAMVPVNLRDPQAEPTLGNCFGLAPLVLPIGIGSPIERVHEIRARMRELRGGFQPALAFLLLAVLGPLPAGLQTVVLEYLAGKASAVMTNLPGPTAPVQLAGARIGRMLFWVPQSGDIGVGIAILSYAGAVQFSIRADTALCPDPQSIVDGFAPEFERLVLTLAMLPNGMLAGEPLAPGKVESLLGLECA